MHDFADNNYLATANNFNTAIADGKFPASGSFISMEPYDRLVFLIRAGTLDSELAVQAYQDTGATQTASVKVITGAVVTVEAGDDNQLFWIEIQNNQLDIANSFTHVTLDVSGQAGSDDYLDILYIGHRPKTVPVTQPATTSGVTISG